MKNNILKSIKYLFIKHKLENVFTPSSVAHLTYINRSSLETEFKKYALLPGMQIVIYGHSGSGKTTLVNNMLKNLHINNIRTICTEETTFDQLILDAFDRLGSFYTCEKGNKETNSISSNISAKYLEIASSIGTTSSNEQSRKEIRIVPIQLTAQRLAEFMGAVQNVWIIEDFHKVKNDEKKKISQVLKVFMDCADDYPIAKIICIGAVGTARELIQYDKELMNRISEMYVPLMSSEELLDIVNKGFSLMNIKCDNESLKQKITHYSNRLASVCHQLCYDICYNNKIEYSTFSQKIITDKDFSNAVKTYLGKVSDTFNKIYEKACSISRCKDLLKEVIKRDDEAFDPKVDENSKEILESKAKEKEKILKYLITPEYGEMFRYNEASKKYYFSSPFFQTFLIMKFALEEAEKSAKKTGTRYELYGITQKESVYMDLFDLIDKNINWETYIQEDFKYPKIDFQKEIDSFRTRKDNYKNQNKILKNKISRGKK